MPNRVKHEQHTHPLLAPGKDAVVVQDAFPPKCDTSIVNRLPDTTRVVTHIP